MPRLRDLPIAAKLCLSALATLALLGGLVWTVQDAMGRLDALGKRSAEADLAARELGSAQDLTQQIRLASQELRRGQAAAAVQEVSRRADQLADAARRILLGLRAKETTDSGKALLQGVEASTAAHVTAVQRARDLRLAMLKTREESFFPPYRQFSKSMEGLRASLAAEDIPYAEMAPLRSALEEYAAAIGALRTVALRFLATEDRSEEPALRDAAGNAAAAIATILGSRVSADLKDEARTVAGIGLTVQHAANELFAAAARAEEFDRGELTSTMDAMRKSLDRGIAEFTTRAVTARSEADAAMGAARRRSLAISAGIAALMLVSGLLTARAVAGPIRAMTRIVQGMAGGETGAAIGYAGRRDEIGRMAAALETLRGAVRRAFVQGQMIDQIPVGVMTAEIADERIAYVNPEATRIMGTVADHLPVSADELAGQTLAVFHGTPERVREIYADPAGLPFRTQLKLGDEVLELLASALRDRDGRYIGPMMTWTVRTAQVRLSDRFERSVGVIAASVGDSATAMTEAAHTMSQSAGESGRCSVAVGAASDQAAGNVQSVAASTEELASTVLEIGRQVAESAQIAGQAVRQAEDTDRCVGQLSDAATRIGDVVKLISDIAGRTNLLALNATIEAARAGEAGKGFAVVASEVKTLATQTARATQEISAQISAMQGEVGRAVGALRSIGATIQRMNEIATGIAGAVEEQGATTQEIARAVQHAASDTTEVHRNIGQVTEAVDRTGQQAEAVLQAARALTTQSNTLKVEVASFLSAVREAA